MEYDLLRRTYNTGDGKTLHFTEALHSGTRRWVHKIAHQLGQFTLRDDGVG